MENEKINSKKSLLKQAEKIEQEEKERILKSEASESEKDSRIHEKGLRRNRKHEKRQRPPRKTVFGSILTKIIIILVLIILFLGAGYIALNRMSHVKATVKHTLIEKELLYCQEFVTLKYKYTDIAALKKAVGPSKSYSIIKYSGIIRAGIADLTQCDIEISDDGKKVYILLPDAEILGNDISSQEVFDESHSIFLPITLDEVFSEINTRKQEFLEEVLDEGILDDAKDYAKKIISQMMYTAGFEDVQVE